MQSDKILVFQWYLIYVPRVRLHIIHISELLYMEIESFDKSKGDLKRHQVDLSKQELWWHISAITCLIIMSTCQIFFLTCQLFMTTCQMLCQRVR